MHQNLLLPFAGRLTTHRVCPILRAHFLSVLPALKTSGRPLLLFFLSFPNGNLLLPFAGRLTTFGCPILRAHFLSVLPALKTSGKPLLLFFLVIPERESAFAFRRSPNNSRVPHSSRALCAMSGKPRMRNCRLFKRARHLAVPSTPKYTPCSSRRGGMPFESRDNSVAPARLEEQPASATVTAGSGPAPPSGASLRRHNHAVGQAAGPSRRAPAGRSLPT